MKTKLTPDVTLNNDCLLKASQLAGKLQTSVRLVRRMAADKEIPFVQLGKAVRFCYADVLAALKLKASQNGNDGKNGNNGGRR
ncbi:MAG: helix-turn-helix domain-containing protein [Limisphaerales bacterium]